MTRAALVVLAACGRFGFGTSTDASGDGDARMLGFCASQQPVPTLCDDFDSGPGALDTNQVLGGTYAIDSSVGFSAPASLEVSIDPVAASSTAGVYVEAYQFGTTTVHATTSFEFRIDTPGMNDLALATLVVDDSMQAHAIELVHRPWPATDYIEDVVTPSGGSQMFMSYGLPSNMDGIWHAVTLDLQPTQLVVTIDGATVLAMAPAASNGGMTSLEIGGVFLQGPSPAWQLHIDNVVAQLQ